MRILRTNILNPLSSAQSQLLEDWLIGIDNGKIGLLQAWDAQFDRTYEDHRHSLLCAGFIDIHVHLSQHRIRGLYQPALLPWLEQSVFPEEAKSRDRNFAAGIAEEFYTALFACGTTCSVIYTAPFKEACQEAFLAADRLGARALIGMTLMDMNAPQSLLQSTRYAIDESISLCQSFHKADGMLGYIFTPRFAPTCSAELMRAIANYATANNIWIQSHLSENKDEISWVKEIFGLDSYTQVYEEYGLLGPHTIMAHPIHLSDIELQILKAYQTKIAHCPDSNFYLKSGEFDLPRIKEAGLQYALGSDVGAGTSLSMPYHAKMMNFRQSSYPVLPSEAFYAITLGAARLLGLDQKIGSIELGKEADLVLLDYPGYLPLDDQAVSRLIFSGHEWPILETLVRGRTVYQQAGL